MGRITFLRNFLKRKRCKHPKVNEYHMGGYCPDCGEKISIKWQTVICQDCNNLLMQKVKNGKISPLNKFCSTCGSSNWYIKSAYRISISERFYAHYIKEIDNDNIINLNQEKTEVWVDNKAEP